LWTAPRRSYSHCATAVPQLKLQRSLNVRAARRKLGIDDALRPRFPKPISVRYNLGSF
jgi:hypothetical protein